jgi:DNA-binding LytR/AlgR family response regulator
MGSLLPRSVGDKEQDKDNQNDQRTNHEQCSGSSEELLILPTPRYEVSEREAEFLRDLPLCTLPLSGKEKRLRMEDLVLLRSGAFSMMVKAREITAIESEGDYTKVLLPDEDGKERRVLMKQTLSGWESQLPAELFSKVSRSLLVNTKAISRLVKRDPTTWEIHFQGIKTSIILSNLESKRLREVIVNTS